MSNSTAYSHIGKLKFENYNFKFEFEYVKEFSNKDDTVVIVSNIEIDCLHRGWIGDITYWATRGYDVANCYDDNTYTSEPQSIKDVLLVRIEADASVESPVEWTYTFLKY